MNSNLTLPVNDDFESILICAIRYAIGRRTYMPKIVCDFIQPLIPYLSNKGMHVMISDIAERGDNLGDPNIDAPQWFRLKNAILREMERRKADGR